MIHHLSSQPKQKAACVKSEMLLDKQLESYSLTLDEDAFLAVHLMNCLPCKTYEKELRDIQQTLYTLEVQPMPTGLTERIMQQLSFQSGQQQKVFFRAIAAVIFGALVSLSLYTYFEAPMHLPQTKLISDLKDHQNETDLLTMEINDPKPDSTLTDVVGY